MEIVVSVDDFISCNLYRVVKTKTYENVLGFGPSLQKQRKKLVLVCGNEDCGKEIEFTFWDSTGVESYDCNVCDSTTRFQNTVGIDFFIDLL